MSKIYVGMGGWDLEPFNRYFYPPRQKKGFRKLEFYSQFFDSVEINATFYKTSFTQDNIARWLNDVAGNKEFMFTVKLFQGFTHTFAATRDDYNRMRTILDGLASAGKLGGLLIQFPSSFSYDHAYCEYLTRLGRAFREYRLFLEVRDKSWNSPLMYNFFQENRFHLVNVDLPSINNHIPFNCLTWNGAAYFRMMGRNINTWNHPWRKEEDGKHMVSDRYHYLYSEREINNILLMIEKIKSVTNTIFVVFHNDPEANSLINGFQIRHRTRHNQRVMIPQNFLRKYPMLKPISAEVNVNHPLFTGR